MGRAKNEQIEHDEKVQYAVVLCVEIGALEECEVHEGEYSDSMEYHNHDELTAAILEDNPNALMSFESRDEMTECVSEAMNSAGEECGYCAKNRDS